MAGIVVKDDNLRLYLWADGDTVTGDDKIANISELGDLSPDTEEVDTSTIDTVGTDTEPGTVDYGSLDLTLNLLKYEYNMLASLFERRDTIRWGISGFDASGEQVVGMQGKGKIMAPGLTGMSRGGILQATASVRISGTPTRDFVDPVGAAVGAPVTKVNVVSATGDNKITTKGGKLQLVVTVSPNEAVNRAYDLKIKSGQEYATLSTTRETITAKADGTVTVVATSRSNPEVSGELEITITGNDSE